MKLKYILPLFLLLGFTGCEEEEILKSILGDPVAIADGDYVTDCIPDGSGGSSITSLTVSGNATSRDIQVDVYTSADCTTGETLGTPEQASIELAEYGFGNSVSFFTEGAAKLPYHVDSEGALYIGVSADSSGEPAEIFADFIDDPTNSGGTKFNFLGN
ncbi:MAG: hypothetical protein ACRBBP_10995 [Bdellovibrionales bacterium]